MGALRRGTIRAEFLHAVEQRMGQSADDLSNFRREEQTPTAEWGLFLKIVGEEGKRFFTKAPERRPGHRQRAQQ
eukprot:1159272-Pyramimonas_sp.AAC.1